MDKSTISITLYGDGLKKQKWIEWYDYTSSVFKKLEYERTHLAIKSEEYNTEKVVTVRRKEKQVLQLLKDGTLPESLTLFSLPKDYRSASFDYNILAVRNKEYISFIFNSQDFEKIEVNNLVWNMKQYIEFESGEIYQMDRSEMPLIYAAKANSVNSFKSLTVLKEF